MKVLYTIPSSNTGAPNFRNFRLAMNYCVSVLVIQLLVIVVLELEVVVIVAVVMVAVVAVVIIEVEVIVVVEFVTHNR